MHKRLYIILLLLAPASAALAAPAAGACKDKGPVITVQWIKNEIVDGVCKQMVLDVCERGNEIRIESVPMSICATPDADKSSEPAAAVQSR